MEKFLLGIVMCLALLSISSCGDPWMTDVTGGCTESYVRDAMTKEFHITPAGRMYEVPEGGLRGLCGCDCACNRFGPIYVTSELGKQSLCQQMAHEYGHAIAHQLYNDWDYGELLLGDWYTNRLFRICEEDPC